jgi:hypothetical protein
MQILFCLSPSLHLSLVNTSADSGTDLDYYDHDDGLRVTLLILHIGALIIPVHHYAKSESN